MQMARQGTQKAQTTSVWYSCSLLSRSSLKSLSLLYLINVEIVSLQFWPHRLPVQFWIDFIDLIIIYIIHVFTLAGLQTLTLPSVIHKGQKQIVFIFEPSIRTNWYFPEWPGNRVAHKKHKSGHKTDHKHSVSYNQCCGIVYAGTSFCFDYEAATRLLLVMTMIILINHTEVKLMFLYYAKPMFFAYSSIDIC